MRWRPPESPTRASEPALIEYLDSLGFTAEEMVAAERRGRLFGLAGDVLQWSGPPIYSLRAAAEELGVPLEELAHAWAVLGLTVADSEQPALSRADVDGLATWVAMKSIVGDDAALGLLRVLGATMARLSEAGATVIRVGQPDIQMTHTQDELTTAQAYRAVGGVHPPPRGADRRRLPPSHDQRPHLLRGRHPRLRRRA